MSSISIDMNTLFESQMDVYQDELLNPGYNQIEVTDWMVGSEPHQPSAGEGLASTITTFSYNVETQPVKSRSFQQVKVEVYGGYNEYLTEINLVWYDDDQEFVDRIMMGTGLAADNEMLDELLHRVSWNPIVRLPQDIVDDIRQKIKEIAKLP